MRLALTSISLAYSMSAEPRRSFGTEIASASPKPPRFVDVDKFDVADGAAARAHLDERGFVVFRSVLDAAEVARANELFFDYVEALGSGVNRNDVNTWGDDRWPPCAGDAGILPWFGATGVEIKCRAQYRWRRVPHAIDAMFISTQVSVRARSCGLFAHDRASPRPTARPGGYETTRRSRRASTAAAPGGPGRSRDPAGSTWTRMR